MLSTEHEFKQIVATAQLVENKVGTVDVIDFLAYLKLLVAFFWGQETFFCYYYKYC